MFYFDYPKVKHSLAQTALQDPYPALYIDTRGVIRGANLMAFWLWNSLQLEEPIRPDTLLGRSIFSIYRLEGDGGFLCMYTPNGSTLPDIEEQYGLLIVEYGDNAYVQLDDQSQDTLENNQLPSKFGSHFRPYYPALIQDPLWYISG